ncbi:MAG: VCBS repeat-containing protein [Deltaproteobacteria bacterium]|nr:VCBS repeat-containing protein [Deltaproteobacteria bacterium]
MARMKAAVMLLSLAFALGGLAAPSPAPARQAVRASLANDGAQADGSCMYSRISGDGRYVVFISDATNLVAGDTNGWIDVFRRDLLTGQTIMVSVSSAGIPGNLNSGFAAISDDGRYVVFESDADNLVTDDTNAERDIFLRDISAGTTVRVSLNTTGGDPNGSSMASNLTGNGRYVTFYSQATNLAGSVTLPFFHAYRYDTQTRTTTLLDQSTAGVTANNPCLLTGMASPMSSADGRYNVFTSVATNLLEAASNPGVNIFERDTETPGTSRISQASDGSEADGTSVMPFMTPDGRYVAFGSFATNLVTADTNGFSDIFLHDRVSGTISRVSLTHDGGQGNADIFSPSLDATAGLVTFESEATNLVADDTNGVADIFVRNLASGAIFRASLSNTGQEADGTSRFAMIAAYAGHVTFDSDATNLVADDTNGKADVFVNGPFLEEAVDNLGLDIMTGDDGFWAPTLATSQSAGDAARSGVVGDGQSSWMETTMAGPGLLAFYWKVSSQADADYLEFYLDGVRQPGRISGEQDWTLVTASLTAGNHTLRWQYVKDGTGAAGSDAGWVDNVQYAVSTRRTMYRAYNVALQYHFFTTRLAEFNNAVAAGYQNESTNPAKLFYMSAEQAPGTVALHRLYNPNSGRHYYTKSNAERDALVAAGWNFERDEGYLFTSADAAPADATEVFHLYHPTIGTHLYTKSASEAAWVVANIPPWQQHTSLGWAYNSLTVGARYAAEADPVSPDSALLRDAAGQAGVSLASLPAWQALTTTQSGAKAGSLNATASVSGDSLAANLATFTGLSGELGSAASGLIPRRDFDGDGVDDLVWADPATGRVSLALMDATGPRETLDLGTLSDRNWRIFEVRDLDGDGGPDLVWWNPITREVSFWLLTGATVTARPVVGRAPEGASLAGVGEFDGDGRLDLAWRRADGSQRLAPPQTVGQDLP